MNSDNDFNDSIAGPHIIDAVVDQHDGHWIRYGTPTRSQWFELRELQLAEKEVFARLSGPGMTFLTTSAKNSFKQIVEGHASYRPALVAGHAGWVGGSHYVFGDGSVIAPSEDPREVIVAFTPDPKFTPMGTLEGWQEAVGPIVTDQALLLFVIAWAVVGGVLRFSAPHVPNPEAEVVGPKEIGKSSIAALGVSVWAGDPNSDVGGGESWDVTVNALDRLKVAHSDSLLVLDEANLAGTSGQDQRELITKAVFKLAATGGRKRYTDKSAMPEVRLAVFSTSNRRLRDIVQTTTAVRGALASRLITISIPKDHPHGVLTSVPAGCQNAREAIERLRGVVDQQYGTAGRTFMSRLVEAAASDEPGLRRILEKRMARFLGKAGEVGSGDSARVVKAFALAYAAGRLAQDYEVVPRSWGSILKACLSVYGSVQAKSHRTSTDPIDAYLKKHEADIVDADSLAEPYSRNRFNRTACFRRRVGQGEEFLIPSVRLQAEVSDHARHVRRRRKAGLARTEKGDQPKLTIKAPRKICASGRVYCIRLSASSPPVAR